MARQRYQTAAVTAVPSLISLPGGTQLTPSMSLQFSSREQRCSSSCTHPNGTQRLRQQPGTCLLASLLSPTLALRRRQLLTLGSGFILVNENMVSSMLLYGV